MLKVSDSLVQYCVVKALCAVTEVGVIDYLNRQDKGVSAGLIAKELRLNSAVLESLLDFLVVNTPNLIAKDNDVFILRREIDNSSVQNSIHFALAYQDVLNNLPGLLTNKVIYGKDIFRDGTYLSKSSSFHNRHASDSIIELIKHDFNTVIDLGCGSGELLKLISLKTSVTNLYGVDNDKTAGSFEDSSTTDHVTYLVGDIALPESWSQKIPMDNLVKTVFVGVTVWHELLWPNQGLIKSVLSKYQQLFPSATLLLVEKNGYSVENLKLLPSSILGPSAVYQMLHPITNQGMPQSPSVWRTIIKEAGLNLMSVTAAPPDMSIYVCKL